MMRKKKKGTNDRHFLTRGTKTRFTGIHRNVQEFTTEMHYIKREKPILSHFGMSLPAGRLAAVVSMSRHFSTWPSLWIVAALLLLSTNVGTTTIISTSTPQPRLNGDPRRQLFGTLFSDQFVALKFYYTHKLPRKDSIKKEARLENKTDRSAGLL